MNIQSVRMKNFRSYLGDNFFDLSKRVTILYGPNGYGKSSFFDAVEWCLTGLISRFDKKRFDTKSVLNLFAEANTECLVEIKFDGNTLVRYFAVVEGELKPCRVKIKPVKGRTIYGQKAVDAFLQKHDFSQPDKQNPFIGLIKQSHILSQDQVTEFVLQDDQEARFRIMADIMGLKRVWITYQNLSDIHSKLKADQKKYEKNIGEVSQKIFEEQSRLIPIESVESPVLNEIFSLTDPNGIRRELQKRKANLTHKNRLTRDVYERYEALHKNLGYVSVLAAKNEVIKTDQLLKDLAFRISSYQTLQKKVTKLHTTLNNQEKRFQRIEELQRNVKELYHQRSEIIDSIQLGDKTPVQLMSELQQTSIKLDYAVEYKQLYSQLLQEERTFPAKQLELERHVLRFTRHQNRLNNLMSRVFEQINSYNEESISKFVSSMESILDFVGTHDMQGYCPLCAYPHEENLFERITHGVTRSIEFVSEDANRIKELHTFVNRIDKSMQRKKNLTKVNEQKLRELRLRMREVERELDKISKNFSFDSELMHQNEDELNRRSLHTKALLQKLNEVIKLEEMISELDVQLKNETDRVGPYRVTFNIKTRLTHLTRAKQRIVNRIHALQLENKRLNDMYNSLSRYVHLADESGISENTTNEEVLSRLQMQINSMEELLKTLEKGESFNNTLEFNRKIETKIEQHQEQLSDLNIQATQYKDAAEAIDKYLMQTAVSMGTKIVDMLNSEKVPVQRYFRYLNPLPCQTPLVFVDEGEKLNIMVKLDEHKEAKTARYTLSSGQLNVLAISLFLAMNESQSVSVLDFVAIDDPIQNMDDVNRFSVCDVLGRVNKQLLFSTHDLDFVKLFIKKNQHHSEDIQVYMLQNPFTSSDQYTPVRFA